MHKMSKESATTLAGLQSRLKRAEGQLNRLKIIVSQEQRHYDKNETSHWGYYNAYKFVLKEIDKLLRKEK